MLETVYAWMCGCQYCVEPAVLAGHRAAISVPAIEPEELCHNYF